MTAPDRLVEPEHPASVGAGDDQQIRILTCRDGCRNLGLHLSGLNQCVPVEVPAALGVCLVLQLNGRSPRTLVRLDRSDYRRHSPEPSVGVGDYGEAHRRDHPRHLRNHLRLGDQADVRKSELGVRDACTRGVAGGEAGPLDKHRARRVTGARKHEGGSARERRPQGHPSGGGACHRGDGGGRGAHGPPHQAERCAGHSPSRSLASQLTRANTTGIRRGNVEVRRGVAGRTPARRRTARRSRAGHRAGGALRRRRGRAARCFRTRAREARIPRRQHVDELGPERLRGHRRAGRPRHPRQCRVAEGRYPRHRPGPVRRIAGRRVLPRAAHDLPMAQGPRRHLRARARGLRAERRALTLHRPESHDRHAAPARRGARRERRVRHPRRATPRRGRGRGRRAL